MSAAKLPGPGPGGPCSSGPSGPGGPCSSGPGPSGAGPASGCAPGCASGCASGSVAGLAPMDEQALCQRFDKVLARIAQAAEKAGRNPKEIGLVAVSKFHPAAAVAALARHWQNRAANEGLPRPCFGENYLQEAVEKQAEVAALLAAQGCAHLPEWHFTGHLQSNKAKALTGRFSLLHTLDSEKLARILHKNQVEWCVGQPLPVPFPVLIQVNIGDEGQKSGVNPAALPSLARAVMQLPGLELRGLMCLPPDAGEAEAVRPYFAALRRLRDDLQQALGLALPCLSMGMSGDLETAVQEGSTLLRVGTDIFGPRPVL